MKENKTQVFILGAGFSKSFCNSSPLMSDLTETLFSEQTKNNRNYQMLCDYIDNVYKKSNQHSDTHDIETIATVLLTKKIFRNDIESNRFNDLKFQLLRFIRDQNYQSHADNNKEVLREFILHNYSAAKEVMARFSNSADINPKINERRVFISLNYDLIIERIAELPFGQNVPVDYVAIDSHRNHKSVIRSNRAIELIKLHGSLNWFKAKGSDNFDIENTFVVNENDPNYEIYHNDIPIFIPMAHSKDSFLKGSLFNTLWAKALSYLDNASDIYFIGYSFPKSDINNLFLFLDYKDKIRKIVVHYENESHNDFIRLRHLFGDIVENKDAKLYIESNWVTSEES